MNASPEILIVAGEASSSLYAERLLEELRRRKISIRAFGVGSQTMEDLGFERIGKSEEMAVVGLQEVLAHFPLIRKVFHGLIEAAEKRRPRFALLLDYPDFNLRLAKKLKKAGIPVYYYISPQLWAWRKGRIEIIKKYVDKMFVLFPFEKEFYEKQGVEVHFVGHPLLDEIESELLNRDFQEQLKISYGLDPQHHVIALMPGSRRSEIRLHLETQIEAAKILKTKFTHLQFMLPLAPSLKTEVIDPYIQNLPFELLIVKDNPKRMIASCDVAICASGTATLMVGMLRKPMVVMYKMKPLTAWIAKRLVNTVKYFGMVNLVVDQKIVPELFQEEASPHQLSEQIGRFIETPSLVAETKMSLEMMVQKLGDRGATQRVTDLLLADLK